jgi:hypothetical protein
LAVREATFLALFEEPIGQLLMEQEHLHLLVFDPQEAEVIKWIS